MRKDSYTKTDVVIPMSIASHIVLTRKYELLTNNPLDCVINEFTSVKEMDLFIRNTSAFNIQMLKVFNKPYKSILFSGTVAEFDMYLNTDEDATC